MLDSMKSVPGIASTPPPSTRLRDFVPDGVQLEARFWAESRRAGFMHTAADARIAMIEALKAAGIQLPDPDQRFVTMVPTPPSAPHEQA